MQVASLGAKLSEQTDRFIYARATCAHGFGMVYSILSGLG
jgi:hypothetical protein